MSDRWTKRENINDKINPEYYIGTTIQLADFIKAFNLEFFEGSIIKYVVRWRKKNKLEDLEKAKWYLEKLIECTKK